MRLKLIAFAALVLNGLSAQAEWRVESEAVPKGGPGVCALIYEDGDGVFVLARNGSTEAIAVQNQSWQIQPDDGGTILLMPAKDSSVSGTEELYVLV